MGAQVSEYCCTNSQANGSGGGAENNNTYK